MNEINDKNLSKFEQEFLSSFLNDIEKRENSSWSKPWDYLSVQNAFSGHEYSGMNELYLTMLLRNSDIEDPRFATFNQARKNGHYIKKGSKGIPIQFFQFINKETGRPWNEEEYINKVLNWTPEERRKEYEKKVPILKTFHVFSAENIINRENQLSLAENEPLPKFNKKVITNELIDRFERELIDNMQVGFVEKHSEGAYYTPSLDEVTMPLKEQFNSYEARTTTLLHELGHATGHKNRLNRELSTNSLSSVYKNEEVRVEIASVFMSNTLGLELSEKQKENHLIYLDGWGEQIKKQPKEFLSALSDSLKIKDYMIDRGNYKNIFLEEEKTLEIDLDSAKEFASAYKKFSNYEYGRTLSEDHVIEMIIEEDYIMPIAYTEDYDANEIFYYEKQVSYDLKNNKVINEVKGDFFEFSSEQKFSVEEIARDLNGASFDDFIAQDNMGLDLDEITEVMQVAVLEGRGHGIEEYAAKNKITAEYFDLHFAQKNLNHVLKNVDNDFFNAHNIDKPENFIEDREFKELVSLQSVHYEEIKEIPFGDTYNINYKGDIESDIEIEKHSNYRDLWEDNFKERFIRDFKNLSLDELKHNDFISSPDLINRVGNNYEEVAIELKNVRAFEKRAKDRDIDGDGIPDRLDAHLGRPEIRQQRDLEKEAEKTKERPQARTR